MKINDNPRKPLPIISMKRPALPEPNKQLNWKQMKLDDAAQSSSAVVTDTNAKSRSSREEQLIITQDNQPMESAQTETTTSDSNGTSNSSQQKDENLQESLPIQEQQELSMPALDTNAPTLGIDDDAKVQPTSIIVEQQVPFNPAISQPEPIRKPQISVASSIETTINNQGSRIDNVNHSLNSLKISAQLHNVSEGRRLIPDQIYEKTLRPMKFARNLAIAEQNPSNLMDQTGSLWRFVLPPEYDPNDTRWTLKYRTNLPGLVELRPQSRVYISYGDLVYCRHVSKDCKSIARRLLSAVFNRNALSVCLTITERSQISDNIGSNIRPELDGHAVSVLLNFVIEYGLQRGWNTDLQPILRTLHSKIKEMRFKYGLVIEC